MRFEVADSNVVYGYDEWKEVKHLADTALKHRLYVSGWALSSFLKRARENPTDHTIVVGYDGDTPVAVGIQRKGCVQVFVKKSHRRKGIGTKVVSTLKSKANTECYGNYGTVGSEYFWKSCDLEMKW